MSHMPTLEQPEDGGAAVGNTRAINTTAPLSGGGDLSADRTIVLNDLGVSAAKLAPDAVTTAKILDSNVTTAKILDANVTLAKMANVATSRLIGRVTAGTGVPEALTGTQATTLLDAVTSGLKGLAPASGGGTANFLRADATWAAPPGAGVIDALQFTPITQGGYNGDNTDGLLNHTIDDWDAGDNSLIQLLAADNAGTRITGIDATSASDGDIRLIINCESKQDAGVLVLRHENAGSAAANRFVTPEERDFYVGPQQMALIARRPLLDASGLVTANHRWHVLGNPRTMRTATQNLHLYPALDVGTVTPISGTLNNWNPTGDLPSGYSWGLAGSDVSFLNHSLLRVGVNAAGATITGMYWGAVAPTTADLGPIKIIMNTGPGAITFKYSDAGSDVDNRFTSLPVGADLVVPSGENAIFIHPTSGGWRLLATTSPQRISTARVSITATDPAQNALAVTPASGHINPFVVQDSLTAQTVAGNIRRNLFSQVSGSFVCGSDTTVYGVLGQVTATKSSGAASLTNVGVYGNASGGAVNYAGLFDGNFRQAGGDVVLNGGSGTTEVVGTTFLYAGVQFQGVSGASTFKKSVNMDNELVPAQITGDQNNYSPASLADAMMLLINSDAARSITGLATGANGRILWVYNTGAFNITLVHASGSSTAANQFRGRGNADVILTPSTGVQLYYSPSLAKWVVMTDTL
jgi:hypothetical protein